MASRRNVLNQTERALWREVYVADLSREGRTRAIDKRVARAYDLAELAVRRYRERINSGVHSS